MISSRNQRSALSSTVPVPPLSVADSADWASAWTAGGFPIQCTPYFGTSVKLLRTRAIVETQQSRFPEDGLEPCRTKILTRRKLAEQGTGRGTEFGPSRFPPASPKRTRA